MYHGCSCSVASFSWCYEGDGFRVISATDDGRFQCILLGLSRLPVFFEGHGLHLPGVSTVV